MSAGQPFVINCPAKIATFWFHKENVTNVLKIETVCNFVTHSNQSCWDRTWVLAPYRHCRGGFNWSQSQTTGLRIVPGGVHLLSYCIHHGMVVHEGNATNPSKQRERGC